MIDNIKDLNLKEISSKDDNFLEKLDNVFKEKLNISLDEIKTSINNFILNSADELAKDFPYIAPYDDYGLMIEDIPTMAKFLKEEATKLENWILSCIEEVDNQIKFEFINTSFDDGESLTGIVFLNKSGKIRHAFAQSQN